MGRTAEVVARENERLPLDLLEVAGQGERSTRSEAHVIVVGLPQPTASLVAGATLSFPTKLTFSTDHGMTCTLSTLGG